MESERLQKIIAAAGLASRRGAEEMIGSGRVTVNGRRAQLGDRADPNTDDIRVDGQRVSMPQVHSYIALNKPPGYVSSLRSTHGERTVTELVPAASRLFPVGRLDKETSGLLLMTNDGDWANLVTHPSHGIVKEYRALVRGAPDESALENLRHGVTLPGGIVTASADVRRIGDDRGSTWLSFRVIEGKKRQIRLMALEVGHPIVALQRVRIGPIQLGSLPEGAWRRLAAEEVDEIRDIARRSPVRSSARIERTS